MAREIDERVVSMQFDNAYFEKNVSQTMSTLDKLKAALSFKDIKTSNINAEINKVDTSGLEKGISELSQKWDALSLGVRNYAANIVTHAMEATEQFVKSMSIDNVTAGWQKYADKTSAVQTIMSATRKEFEGAGNQMELVNEQLSLLNWFTDETSFKFLDMVNNIGKFTSNGVSLSQSVTAMQGISTWAAISGANVNEAGRAMYNLSQAVSVGAVKLMDWKSIENANMGTVEFKETVLETAEALGTLEKITNGANAGKFKIVGTEEIVDIATFNQNLDKMWFSSEVLLESLNKYGGFSVELQKMVETTGIETRPLLNMIDDFGKGTLDINTAFEDLDETAKLIYGDADGLAESLRHMASAEMDLGRRAFKAAQETKTFQEAIDYVKESVSSGWMQSFEIIFGDYEHAKSLWSDVTDDLYTLFVQGGEERNDILSQVFGGGYDNLARYVDATGVEIETFEETLKDLYNTANDSDKAFDDMIADFGTLEQALNHEAISADMLTEALAKAGVEGFSKLEDGSYAASDGLDELITKTTQLSGRDLMIETYRDLMDSLLGILEELGGAWDDVFGDASSDIRKMTGALQLLRSGAAKVKEFVNALRGVDEEGQKIEGSVNSMKTIFQGLFAIFDIGKMIIADLWDAIDELVFNSLRGASTGIASFLAKVSNAILRFREWYAEAKPLQKIIVRLGESIYKLASSIFNLLKQIYELPAVQKIVEKVKESFNSMIEFVGEKLELGITKISEFIDKLANLGDEDLDPIKGRINGFIESLAEFFTGTDSLSPKRILTKLTNTKDGIKNILDSTAKYFDLTSDKFEGAKKAVLDLGKLALGVGITKTFMDGVNQLYKGLKFLWEPIQSFNLVLNNLGTAIRKMGDAAVGVMRGAVFVEIATGILAIAGAFYLLSLIPSDKLFTAISIIVSLSAAIGLLMLAMSKLGLSGNGGGGEKTKQTFKDIATGLFEIAGAIALIAASVWVVSKAAEGKGFVKGISALAGAIVAIGILSKVLLTDGKKFPSGAAAMMSIAASIYIMTYSIERLSGITMDEPLKTLGSFIAIVGAIYLIASAASKVGWSGVVAMTGLAVGVKMIVSMIKTFEKLEFNFTEKKINQMIGIFALYTVLLVAARGAGEAAGKAGLMILMITASMVMLKKALEASNVIDVKSMWNMAGALAALGVVFLAMIYVSQYAGKEAIKAGAMILMISTALAAMVGLIFILNSLDTKSIIKGTIAILALGFMFSGLIWVTKYTNLNEGFQKGIIGLGVAIGLLVGALILVSGIPADDAYRAVGILSTLMVAFGFMSTLLSTVKVTSFGQLVGMITAIGVCMAALGGVIYMMRWLNEVDPNGLQDKIIGVVSIVGALSLITMALGSVKTFNPANVLQGIAMIVLSGSILVEITGIMKLLENIKVEGLQEKILVIGECLAGLTLLVFILSAFPSSAIPAVTSGIVSISEVIVALVAVLTLIGSVVNEFEWIEPGIDKAIEILDKIVVGLFSILGKALGSYIEEFSNKIDQVATNLNKFTGAIQSLTTGLSGIDTDTLTKLKDIITALDDVVTITESPLFTEDYNRNRLQKNLKSIVIAFEEFANRVSVSSIANDTDIVSKINTFADVGNKISSMLTNGDGSGIVTLMQKDYKGKNLKESLENVAKGICAYSNVVSETTIDSVSITKSVTAGLQIAKFMASIPTDGGFLDKIFSGTNKIDSNLPEQFEYLAKAVVSFQEQAKSVTETTAIERAIEIGNKIIEFANNIPTSGGFVSMFIGEKDMSTFGDNIESFMGSLIKASDLLTKDENGEPYTFDTSAIDNAIEIGNKIVAFAGTVPEIGGISSIMSGEQSLTSFGAQLSNFSTYLYQFAQNMDLIDLEALKTKMDQLNAIDMEVVNNFVTIITDRSSEIKEAAQSCADVFITAYIAKFADKGGRRKEMIAAMSDSVKAQADAVSDKEVIEYIKTAFNTIIDNVVETFTDRYEEFKMAGRNVVSGFVEGILSEESIALLINAGTTIGKAALTAAQAALDSHSPSRKFMELGKFSAEGLALGIKNNAYIAYEQANKMGKDALAGAKEALASIKEATLSDGTYAPTISPVVDLSRAKAISKGINLDMSANVKGIYSDAIRPVSSYMREAETSINNSNGRLINAIIGMREDLATLYNTEDPEISLYVDSKKLASSIAKPMNRELNILSKRGV